MVYAPNADVEFSGTADVDDPTVFNTQIIGLNVHVTGNAVIDIVYDDQDNYPKPAYIDLIE
jgi:hypothetical protein